MDIKVKEAIEYVQNNVVWVNPLKASAEQYRKSIDTLIDYCSEPKVELDRDSEKLKDILCIYSKKHCLDCSWYDWCLNTRYTLSEKIHSLLERSKV